MKNLKLYFQNIHYQKVKPFILLNFMLNFAEMFYNLAISFKNILYDFRILTEHKVDAEVICVGNLTTGGVGKTPLVTLLASENSGCCIISRGYGAKISNKNPVVVKDFNKIYFNDGRLCGDEVFQLALNTPKNTAIVICADRLKAAKLAIEKFGITKIILDDGFSNRKLKKDKTILLIDSKMRFGNGHLLPKGPLREPQREIRRADEVILVNKNDDDIKSAISWVKLYNKPTKLYNIVPKRIYNIQTHADVLTGEDAIAFSAIGQNERFFEYAVQFYNIKQTIGFEDHYKYSLYDLYHLVEIAKKYNVHTLVTTQKDEAKIANLVQDIKDFNFNILELSGEIVEI